MAITPYRKVGQMTLQERIDAMVSAAVEKALSETLGQDDAMTVIKDVYTGRQKREAMAEEDTTPKRRRRSRPSGPRTTYVVALRKGAKVDTERLFPTALACWKAIVRRSPMTAPEMEKATGLGKKTVESCIWFLRTNGYIKSRAL